MTTTTTTRARAKTTTRVGNLTRDPVLRFSAKGAPWLTTAMAVDRRQRLEDGTWEDQPPEFYDVVCFGDLAENVAECLVKGDRVMVVGKVEDATWTGRDGKEHNAQKIVADDVGTSLRRGTVEVKRTKRQGPGFGPDALARDLAATRPEELFGEGNEA